MNGKKLWKSGRKKKNVISLDIGTTRIKCHIYNDQMVLAGEAVSELNVLISENRTQEIDPSDLWNKVVNIVKTALYNAQVQPYEVECLGISSQRNTFITWDRETGQPFHNFITWKDLRSNELAESWNNSFMIKTIKWLCYGIYLVAGSDRYLTASLLKFTNHQVTTRLLWMLNNNIQLQKAVERNTAMFGTLDTWLIYKLTDGEIHCTDISCASATGMFDPFTRNWAIFLKFLKIPVSIFPCVCDSVGNHFGAVSATIWGSPIKITCSIADQSASLFGSSCCSRGDVKLTLGTGAFLDVNVGAVALASKTGLYPLIGWKRKEIVYILEGACHDCGTILDWAQRAGFFTSVSDLDQMINLVHDADGVYFIPAFAGLQIPIDDGTAAAGFIGLKCSTTKSHMLRAILESIVFQVYNLYSLYRSDVNCYTESCKIHVDGGVSQNNFICQSLADICELTVSRPKCTEMSARGAAHLAIIAAGVCKKETSNDNAGRLFSPVTTNRDSLRSRYNEWKKARERFTKWYTV